MPSLRCLISALTQAGGGDLLFRFASSVQSCCGEGGALQTDIAFCGEHPPCSGHTGFAPHRGVCAFPTTLLRLPAALHGAGPALSAVPVFGSSTKARIWCACVLCLPRPERFKQPEAWAPSPRVRCAFFLRGERPRQPEALVPSPRMRRAFSLRGPSGRDSGSLYIGTGACLPGGRGWLLWG